MDVVPARAEERSALEVFLRDQGSLRVARRSELVDALDHRTLRRARDGVIGDGGQDSYDLAFVGHRWPTG
jgi:hypothetical protein